MMAKKPVKGDNVELLLIYIWGLVVTQVFLWRTSGDIGGIEYFSYLLLWFILIPVDILLVYFDKED
jgi:hypothetical protein